MDDTPDEPAPPPIGTPIAGTPPYPTGVAPILLESTSQGRRHDIPPEHWIPEELRRYGVVGILDVQGSNLNGTPHPIFNRERWPGMSNSRFRAIHQSVRLASILLEIGMPYLASFLPESDFRPDLTNRSKPWRPLEVIDIRKKITKSEMRIARNELDEITRNFEWREDPDIFEVNGWWGITASSYPKTTANFGTTKIIASSAMDKELMRDGFTRRTCTIGICSQYVDTLLRTERASEQHLCAAFHLAVTLVHEIAHMVFWQNISNSPVLSLGYEPSIDGQPYLELGFAFTGWIFGGWNPQPIRDNESEASLFSQGMYWDKQLSDLIRPKWKVNYSMPFEFVQRLMTQSTWDEWMDNLSHPRARSIVLPQTPFRYGQDARTAHCEKVETARGWSWKKKLVLEARFEEEDDDYEDYIRSGNTLPGVPPSGFEDEDWTAGPEAENYGADYRPHKRIIKKSLTSRLQPKADTTTINVTYAGIYHQGTNTVLVDPTDGSDEQNSNEPASTLAKYQGWTEGVLRGLSVELDLCSFGKKDELAARLARYESATGVTIQGTTGSTAAPRNTGPAKELSFTLEWQTKVGAFKQQLFERTGIPVELQLLQLADDSFIEGDLEDDTLRGWRVYYDTCEELRLYRIQSADRPDPGPLPPSTHFKRRHAQVSFALTPFHIAIVEDAGTSPRLSPPYPHLIPPRPHAPPAPPTTMSTTGAPPPPPPPTSIPAYILSLGTLPAPLPASSFLPLPSGDIYSGDDADDEDEDFFPGGAAGWPKRAAVYRQIAEALERECHEARAGMRWGSVAEAERMAVEYLVMLGQVLGALKRGREGDIAGGREGTAAGFGTGTGAGKGEGKGYDEFGGYGYGYGDSDSDSDSDDDDFENAGLKDDELGEAFDGGKYGDWE